MLRELCGENRGDCDLQKFSSSIKRLLPECKEKNNESLIEIMYNNLDKNHDGKIDVNELCNSMIIFHHPDTYRNDAEIWKKISKVNWIPMNKCHEKLVSVGYNPSNCLRWLEMINLEGNPNITFSQFLRSKGTPFRADLEQSLGQIVTSIETPDPSPLKPNEEKNPLEHKFEKQGVKKRLFSPNKDNEKNIIQNENKGFSFSDNQVPQGLIQPEYDSRKIQILQPSITHHSPAPFNQFDVLRKIQKPSSPFINHRKPQIIEVKRAGFNPQTTINFPQMNPYNQRLTFDNSKLNNSPKKPRYVEQINSKSDNKSNRVKIPSSTSPNNLQKINQNPTFLRSKEKPHEPEYFKERKSSKPRRNLLQCTPLLSNRSQSPKKNPLQFFPQPPTIIRKSISPVPYIKSSPRSSKKKIYIGNNPFIGGAGGIVRQPYPIRIDGRRINEENSQRKERTPSPFLMNNNRIVISGSPSDRKTKEKLGKMSPKYVNKQEIKKKKKNSPVGKSEESETNKENSKDRNEVNDLTEHNKRHKEIAEREKRLMEESELLASTPKKSYSPPKFVPPPLNSTEKNPNQISLESISIEPPSNTKQKKEDEKLNTIQEESYISNPEKRKQSNPINRIEIDKSDFTLNNEKVPKQAILKNDFFESQAISLKIPQRESENSPSSSPAPLIKKRPQNKNLSNTSDLVLKRIPLGLNNINCEELAQFLKSILSGKQNKSLNLSEFKELMTICKPINIHSDNYNEILQDFFNLIDINKNGEAERTELANALILLSGGCKKSKIKAAFDFYDTNGDKNLDRKELVDYFIGVLKLKWTIDPSLKNYNEESIKRIAAACSIKCFEIVDKENKGLINLKQFTEFILNGGEIGEEEGHFNYTLNETRRAPITREEIMRDIADSNTMIDKIRKGFPFDKIHISVALHCLKKENEEVRVLDKLRFRDFLTKLVNLGKIKIKFRDGFDTTLSLFFKIFDVENKGIIDVEMMSVGLFIFCGNFI